MKLRSLLFLCLVLATSAIAADWQPVQSPNAGTQANSLSGVSAVADNDVWAVGWSFNQRQNVYGTEIQHWNGSTWSLVTSPNATNGYNFLNGIAVVAVNDICAVSAAVCRLTDCPDVIGCRDRNSVKEVIAIGRVWTGYQRPGRAVPVLKLGAVNILALVE